MSMLGGLGADPKAQKQIQKLAGGFFAQQEATDKALSAEAKTGEIPVLALRYTTGNAEAEMKMNRGAFTYVTGGAGAATWTVSAMKRTWLVGACSYFAKATRQLTSHISVVRAIPTTSSRSPSW